MRKRGKSRFSSGPKRALRFRLKYATDPLCHRAKVLLPVKYAHLETALINLDDFEITLFDAFETEGIPEELWPFYMAWAKRKMKKGLKFWDSTFTLEAELLRQEFVLRGLDETTLENLEPTVDGWLEAFRGLPVYVERIENGGFETGDFTGWIKYGDPWIVTWETPHGGVYHLCTFPGEYDAVEQTLSDPISYEDIDSFTLWFRAGPSSGAYIGVVVTYDDDSTTSFNQWSGYNIDYHEVDVKAHLLTDKKFKAIKIQNSYDGTGQDFYCDDISLMGTPF